MDPFPIETVDCDVLIAGGGMAGCGAAWEAARAAEGKGLRVVLADKATIDHGGPVGMGIASIDCFVGAGAGENAPEDFVRHVRRETMGLCREDLVYDVARQVDDSVRLFEGWGLPIPRGADGGYLRKGSWRIEADGRDCKRIVAEAARAAVGADNVFERVFVSHLLTDRQDPGRIAGAVGFRTDAPGLLVFRARAVVCASGGATGVWRPHRLREGVGRFWAGAFNSGSAYRLMIAAGAEMSQMEHRVVLPRFKDGYGPVGMWPLVPEAAIENAAGEDVERKHRAAARGRTPDADEDGVPVTLRNFRFMQDISAGHGPFRLALDPAYRRLYRDQPDALIAYARAEGLAEYVDGMTLPQAVAWAQSGTGEAKTEREAEAEVYLGEPFLAGSHASGCGAWVSGPDDLAPAEWRWGPNRMTTVAGLFAAGDGVGGAAHKFSSGSHAEGRIAGRSAAAYAAQAGERAGPDAGRVEAIAREIRRPFETFEAGRGASSRDDVNPHYLLPGMGLLRLQKIMDEYCGGPNAHFRVNRPTLERGLELFAMLTEDLDRLAARDLRELLRCQELRDRVLTAECHLRHVLYREETRWPGDLFRPDHPATDDENWKVFVNSRYDAATGGWHFSKKPVKEVVGPA